MQQKRLQTFHTKQGVKVLKGTSYVIPCNQIPLGKGSFGSVEKVYDLSRRDLDLAIKIIPKKKDFEKSAKKEKSIIEKLPYCINLVNYQKFCLESNNNYYFVMEYCADGNLFDLIQRGNKIFSEQEIVEFLVQFLNGYRSLLKHNIIHRDIKPQNIMIHNGIYKIGDFGMSKVKQDESQEFLQFTSSVGSPFYQMDFFQSNCYNKDIDVYSLGVILFQMLFASPNRIIFQQKQDRNTKIVEQPHPLLDLRGVKNNHQFYQLMRQIKDQAEVFNYLDQYIAISLIKRSGQMIALLKSMLMINPQQRITFEQLFEHPLFKQQLDQIDNEQYKNEIQNKIINENIDDKFNTFDNQDFEEIQCSNIFNIEDIKKQLLEQKLEICEQFQKIGLNDELNKNSLLQEKQIHLQKLKNQDKEKNNNAKDSDVDKIELAGNENDKNNAECSGNEKENNQNLINRQESFSSISSNDDSQEGGQEESQQNEKQEQEIEEMKIDGQSYSENGISERIKELVKESEIRLSQQSTIKKIEDILVFFRQVFINYKKIAQQLSKSYSIVKSNNQRTITDFTQLFDNMTFFSLLMFKDQILNLRNNFEQILLDQSLFKNNQNQLIDQLLIKDEDVRIYKNSEEKKLFIQILDNDLLELQKLLGDLMSKTQFKQIHQTYLQIADSISVVKEYYKDYLIKLIQSGIEEFGFLEEKTYQEFQKTLLYLTEIDSHERNNKLYYQYYKFSRGELLLRFEQIETSDDQAQQLSLYCQRHDINLIAQTD